MMLSQLKFGQVFTIPHTVVCPGLCVFGGVNGLGQFGFMVLHEGRTCCHWNAGDMSVELSFPDWQWEAIKSLPNSLLIEKALRQWPNMDMLGALTPGTIFKYAGVIYTKLDYPHPTCCGAIDTNFKFTVIGSNIYVEKIK